MQKIVDLTTLAKNEGKWEQWIWIFRLKNLIDELFKIALWNQINKARFFVKCKCSNNYSAIQKRMNGRKSVIDLLLYMAQFPWMMDWREKMWQYKVVFCIKNMYFNQEFFITSTLGQERKTLELQLIKQPSIDFCKFWI